MKTNKPGGSSHRSRIAVRYALQGRVLGAPRVSQGIRCGGAQGMHIWRAGLQLSAGTQACRFSAHGLVPTVDGRATDWPPPAEPPAAAARLAARQRQQGWQRDRQVHSGGLVGERQPVRVPMEKTADGNTSPSIDFEHSRCRMCCLQLSSRGLPLHLVSRRLQVGRGEWGSHVSVCRGDIAVLRMAAGGALPHAQRRRPA